MSANAEIRERLVQYIVETTGLDYDTASRLYTDLAKEIVLAYAKSLRRLEADRLGIVHGE